MEAEEYENLYKHGKDFINGINNINNLINDNLNQVPLNIFNLIPFKTELIIIIHQKCGKNY